MVNRIAVLSAPRVGSTWLWLILRKLTNRDGVSWTNSDNFDSFIRNIGNNVIVKAHHPHPLYWFKYFRENDYVVNISRNLYDTIYSYAYFCMYCEKGPVKEQFHQYRQQTIGKTTEEEWPRMFIKTPMFVDVLTQWAEYSMFKHPNYIKIAYESLQASPVNTMKKVIGPLSLDINMNDINQALEWSSFERYAKRKKGTEDKKDAWRKGVVGDGQSYYTQREKNIIHSKMKEIQQLTPGIRWKPLG